MAGRRRLGKQAYRMTARRKAALRKAQLISARKRRRNNAAKVGVAGLVGAAAVYAGYKQGSFNGIAADLKSRDFRFTNTRSQVAKFVQPKVKEDNLIAGAVSPASAKPQAPPVNSPSMGSTSTPKPNSGGRIGVPKGLKPVTATVTQVASEGQVLDSANLAAASNPYPDLPGQERIVAKLGKPAHEVTQSDLWDLSEIWVVHDIKQGRRMKMGKLAQRRWAYKTMLDMFGLKTKTQIKEEQQAAKKAGS